MTTDKWLPAGGALTAEGVRLWAEKKAGYDRVSRTRTWAPAGTVGAIAVWRSPADEKHERENPPETVERRRILRNRDCYRHMCARHEAAHFTYLCLRNRGSAIVEARVLDVEDRDGKRGFVSFQPGLPRDIEVGCLAAGLTATAAEGWDARGVWSDMQRLAELGAISRADASHDFESAYWAIHEPQNIRALREEIARELEPEQRFIDMAADELCWVGRLSGAQIRSAWANRRAICPTQQLFQT